MLGCAIFKDVDQHSSNTDAPELKVLTGLTAGCSEDDQCETFFCCCPKIPSALCMSSVSVQHVGHPPVSFHLLQHTSSIRKPFAGRLLLQASLVGNGITLRECTALCAMYAVYMPFMLPAAVARFAAAQRHALE